MKLILIPCSGSKVSGGSPNSLPSKLQDDLSTATFQKLLNARQELETVLQNNLSFGLGYTDNDGQAKYLPATQRYQGLIYAHSNISQLFPTFTGRLIIVSALYGLLDGSDLIRNYELQMSDTLPTGMRVGTFWRQHKLRDILLELISRVNADEVHDILSGHYREALRPWPDPRIKNINIYDYPGMGQGSSFERAKDLKRLLS